MAVDVADPETVHRRRAGGLPDRCAARVLPRLAQSANRAGEGRALPAGGSTGRGRLGNSALRFKGAGRADQLALQPPTVRRRYAVVPDLAMRISSQPSALTDRTSPSLITTVVVSASMMAGPLSVCP